MPNMVPRLAETPGVVDTLGPSLGQHNAEVYGKVLGLAAGDLSMLERGRSDLRDRAPSLFDRLRTGAKLVPSLARRVSR